MKEIHIGEKGSRAFLVERRIRDQVTIENVERLLKVLETKNADHLVALEKIFLKQLEVLEQVREALES